MKIIKKFQDYYDGVRAFGGYDDSGAVYDRVRREITYTREFNFDETGITLPNGLPNFRNEFFKEFLERKCNFRGIGGLDSPAGTGSWGIGHRHDGRLGCSRDGEYKFFIVGFCGDFYFGVENSWFTHPSLEYKRTHFYENDLLVDKIKEVSKEFSKKVREYNVNYISSLLERFPLGKMKIAPFDQSIFFEINSPSIYIEMPKINRENLIVINPVLKELDFYRVFDAYTAYQEIDMFVGGVLSSNSDGEENLTDDDRRVAKGFNDMSFKKEATKKR